MRQVSEPKKVETLFDVPHYDFSWQRSYILREPIRVPKGTQVEFIGTYDNSVKNKFNPDPKKDIRWGDPTYEEMTIGWIDYTVDSKSLKGVTASNGGGEQ